MSLAHYTFLRATLAVTLGGLVWASMTVSHPQHIDQHIHGLVLRLMECHMSPALTIAVVKDGRILLTAGYGYTSTNRSHRVTSDTKFAIGSLTKAFTSTLVAKWLYQQPHITLDTNIKSYFPAFRVTDDQRSSQATLRDLLSHRMGLPSYFKPLLMGFPRHMTRDELVRRLAHMPTPYSFREKFVYNNYMYTMAAHVIEKMSDNRKWEELVQESFLTPLGMSGSGFLYNLSDFSNFALPCAMLNDSIRDLPTDLFHTVSPNGPAGSIYSNAQDMAKWMKFLLSNGRGARGQQLVEPQVILMTHQPGMISSLTFDELTRPRSTISHVPVSYNLGWMTANYRGYRKIFHSGGVITHSSRLWLYPDIHAGIYISVNGPQIADSKQSLLESLMYLVSDLLLGETPWLEEESICQNLAPTPSGPPESLQTIPSPQPNVLIEPSSPDLQQFLGNYSHLCFGNIEICLDAAVQKLVFKFGLFGNMVLDRVTGLDFRGFYVGPLSYLNPGLRNGELVQFVWNSRGVVDALLFSMDSAQEMTLFNKSFYLKDITGLFDDRNHANSAKQFLAFNCLCMLLSVVAVC